MALTISITKKGMPRDFDEGKSVTFDGSTGFWEYLSPWIQGFNKKCSESVDLYAVYNLDAKNLPVLIEELSKARVSALQGPAMVSIHCGTVTRAGASEEIIQSASREELVTFIDKMISITKEAIESGETLANLGD